MAACGNSSHQFHERHRPKSTAGSTIIRHRRDSEPGGDQREAVETTADLARQGPRLRAGPELCWSSPWVPCVQTAHFGVQPASLMRPARRAAMTPPSMSRSLPVMKPASGPSRNAAAEATSSAVPTRPAAEALDHRPVAGGAGAGHLVLGERGEDDAGADRVDAGAALAPGDGGGLDAQVVGALGHGVGGAGVRHGARRRGTAAAAVRRSGCGRARAPARRSSGGHACGRPCWR